MGVIVHDFNGNPDITINVSTNDRDRVKYVLTMDGIETESQPNHSNGIVLESWSWGESNAADSASGSGAGKVKMQDFQFTMRINRASPQLLLACATGKHLKKAVLTGQTGETPQNFLKFTFSDVVIAAFQTGVPPNSNSTPIDHVSIRYTAIDYEYITQKPDGSTDSTRVGWNLKENRPV